MYVDNISDLVLETPGGQVNQHKPVIYQQINVVRHEIAGAYVPRGKRLVGFEVAQYDMSQPLIFDPILGYSTYLGGAPSDSGLGIAVDLAGNVYVTGAPL